MSQNVTIDRNANTPERIRRAVQIIAQNGVIKTTGKYIVIDDDSLLAIKSPNGHYWGLTVDNSGVLTTTDLGTGRP